MWTNLPDINGIENRIKQNPVAVRTRRCVFSFEIIEANDDEVAFG